MDVSWLSGLLLQVRSWWLHRFADVPDSEADPAPAWARWAAVGIGLLAGLLFLMALDAPLLEPQEARYAEIPRQMLAEGRWIVPTLNGQNYLDKPPLLYWAVMCSYQLLGVSDVAARLVPGLAGLLLVLVSLWWGWWTLGWRAGLSGALLLCLMPEFLYRGRMLTFDVLLALWVVTAWASGHVASLGGGRRWGWWLLSALCCGMGLLTKGPVALVLVAIPLFALARPGIGACLFYVGVGLAVAGPWYAAILVECPEFGGYFFWRHNLTRFVAPFDHAGPPWYYLPALALGGLPWWLVAFTPRSEGGSAPQSQQRHWMASAVFPLLCFAWTLLFFSLAGCKRPTYLLPALPPLALALGWLLRQHWWQPSRLATLAALVVLTGGSVVGLLAALQQLAPLAGWTLVGLAGLTLLTLLIRSRPVSWGLTACLMAGGLLFAVLQLLPAYNHHFSLRDRLAAADPEGPPIVCYPQCYDSVRFYRPEQGILVFTAEQQGELLAHLQRHPGSLLLVKSGSRLQQLLAELPADLAYQAEPKQGAIAVGRVLLRPGR